MGFFCEKVCTSNSFSRSFEAYLLPTWKSPSVSSSKFFHLHISINVYAIAQSVFSLISFNVFTIQPWQFRIFWRRCFYNFTLICCVKMPLLRMILPQLLPRHLLGAPANCQGGNKKERNNGDLTHESISDSKFSSLVFWYGSMSHNSSER